MLLLVVGKDEKMNRALASALQRAYELMHVGNSKMVFWSAVDDPKKRVQLSSLVQVAQTRFIFAAPDVEVDIRVQPLLVEEYRIIVTDPVWCKTRPDTIVVFNDLGSTTLTPGDWFGSFVHKNDGDIYVNDSGYWVDDTYFAASGIHFLRRSMALSAIDMTYRSTDLLASSEKKEKKETIDQLRDASNFFYNQTVDIRRGRVYG